MSHQKLALVEIEKLHLWVLTSCSGIKQRNWNELLLGTIKYWSRIAQPQLALSLVKLSPRQSVPRAPGGILPSLGTVTP